MRHTWRWFGPRDTATIEHAVQAGAKGIVTALHHVPAGEVWTREAIEARCLEVRRHRNGAPTGVDWEVVESLPVSEAIKLGTTEAKAHIEAWRASLENLARAGIRVVCYNFMPLLDWTRTDLAYRVAHGGTTMRFDRVDFAVYDIHLLRRPGAREDHPEDIVETADRRFADAPDGYTKRLATAVGCGLPGEAHAPSPDDLRHRLDAYRGVDADRSRARLVAFLEAVVPDAERLGMRLCCHPDDPPFPLLGLPRVMSTQADFAAVAQAVPNRANGITLCSGSLGARADNDLPDMMRRLGDRVHFLHLRNVRRETAEVGRSFHESEHLDGDVDMVALVREILAEERRRRAGGRDDHDIPMRPDHGQSLADDLVRGGQPGYPVVGRLKGLAELRGLETALARDLP